MKRLLATALLLLSSVALAQGVTPPSSGGISANCPSCNLIDATLTLSGLFSSTVAANSDAIELTEGARLSLNGGTGTSYVVGDTGTHGLFFFSAATSGNPAFQFKATTSGNIINILNGATSEFTLNNNGFLLLNDGIQLNGAATGHAYVQATNGNLALWFIANVNSGGNAFVWNNNTTLATGNIGVFQNNGTNKSNIDVNGNYLIGVAPKAAASFTAVNQGSSTLTDIVGGLRLSNPASGSSANARVYVETLSATNTLHGEVAVRWASPANDGALQAGVVARESATGKLYTCGPVLLATNGASTSGVWYPDAQIWSAANSLTSFSHSAADWVQFNGYVFYRVRRSSTNILCEVSANGGVDYYVVDTKAVTTPFTTAPDQIGVVLSNSVSAHDGTLTPLVVDFVSYNSGT